MNKFLSLLSLLMCSFEKSNGLSSFQGMRQCLVQLSTMPVAVCHGTGATIDDAHGQAAHNALQYLKVMMSIKS